MTNPGQNLFDAVPDSLESEVFEELLRGKNVRIERILSHGHSSPESGWHDQEENEWVLVLQGKGEIRFEDGRSELLSPGDHLILPAHTKHRVHWTDPKKTTVWLAVFYS